jgi:hypothetical protein
MSVTVGSRVSRIGALVIVKLSHEGTIFGERILDYWLGNRNSAQKYTMFIRRITRGLCKNRLTPPTACHLYYSESGFCVTAILFV